MIFEVIFTILAGIVRAIFFVTQMLPPMPAVVTDLGDLIATYAATGMGFMFEVLGKPLGVAILTLVPAYIIFKFTFAIMVWVWKLVKL